LTIYDLNDENPYLVKDFDYMMDEAKQIWGKVGTGMKHVEHWREFAEWYTERM
jgi:hypothetical protein